MQALYETLEDKKVGIFESPTGTGKTLSLICASMSWLRDYKRNKLKKLIEEMEDSNEPSWIREQAREIKRKEFEDQVRELEQSLAELRQIEKQEALKSAHNHGGNKNKKYKVTSSKSEFNDDEFLVDYEEDERHTKNGCSTLKNGFTPEVQTLLDRLASDNKRLSGHLRELDVDEELFRPKIYFASRTHSQLSQFMGQLKLTEFPPSILNLEGEDGGESVKALSLASRKQLCIHKRVSKYQNSNHQSDACHDMQKKDSTRCEFLMNHNELDDKVKATEFKNRALAQIRDIEELADLGKKLGVCPYYESRNAAVQAEIVTLPYQLLIQKSSRKALGIDLKDSIVIIDEAHNIMDTVSNIYSEKVTAATVKRAREGLEIYYDKFSRRFSGTNRVLIAQTIRVIQGLEQFFENAAKKPFKETSPGTEVPQSNILQHSSTDTINVYKLQGYLDKSKLAFKVESYLEKRDRENGIDPQKASKTNTVLSSVVNFLLAVTNPSGEGKMFYDRDEHKQLQLQYLLVDPSAHFKEIVDDARCVILAGGTMEPTGDYLDYLFPYLSPAQIRLFSCGHVIPHENLSVSILCQGPAKQEFKFTFANRNSPAQMAELGRALITIASQTPKGMVVFFPSYSFLDQLTNFWKKGSTWAKIDQKKKIFMESKNTNPSVESILAAYSMQISTHNGAALFSVVGGKMSEGINFSDDLARSVIMVGLPFPNLMSAELIAKRQYIESKVLERGGTPAQALAATKDFYENICLRAVNQSIGRAIRHANDYSTIVLVDSRYATSAIQAKLPRWIRDHIDPSTKGTVPEYVAQSKTFFQKMKI
ncbi:ATP-dependent DNA helicase Chl1p [Trichomonascus vanleenenianus]|uniref:DNA helicase n=1 Tax=Trichomonascus vanleenenianus TaxID=2268995 RepID=UPI003ECB102A